MISISIYNNLKTEAYAYIKRMIEEGKIKYGEIYFINNIADELKMSRTPVRDAVQMLGEEKRIDILPSRGFRLHYITDDEIVEMYHLSVAIEGYCVANLAKRFKSEGPCSHIVQLTDLYEKMRDCDLDDISFGEFFSLDDNFHRVVIDSFFKSLSDTNVGFYNRPELHISESQIDKLKTRQEHQNILEAIYAGDPTGAYMALMAHADTTLIAYKASHNDSDNY